MNVPGIVLHGGTPLRRQQVAQRLLAHAPLHVRYSSRAAEAAKCLRDDTVVAVVLIDAPRDGASVRALVSALVQSASTRPFVWEYDVSDEAGFVARVTGVGPQVP
ncbi:MAG: hypothetical protein IT353_04370 [Gemmatimonadaceae bacterium]|nr:hypothetical protein [Gemmatimonadaceae bacterium]